MSAPAETGTHYELLGVDCDATQQQITSAYRKLARKLHPDVNPDADPAGLAKISDAYAVLSRPDARRAYDAELGLTGTAASPHPGHGTEQPVPGPTDSAPAGPAVGEEPPTTWQDGLDVHTRIIVPAAEATPGTALQVPVSFRQPCGTCGGSGFDQLTLDRSCPSCSGMRMHPVSGELCPYCVGIGRVSAAPCGTCAGDRAVPLHTTVTVEVPAGFRPGSPLRAARKGAVGGDGRTRGHVFVHLTLTGLPEASAAADTGARNDAADGSSGPLRAGRGPGDFMVAANGLDVGVQLAAIYPELRLGAKVTVGGPDGRRHQVTLPPGTPPGTILRVPGAGHADPDSITGRRADLHVQVSLRFPDGTPTPAETDALAVLANLDRPAG